MAHPTFHVALIMDGNGRWAKKQGKPRTFGHKQGAKVLRTIIQACPHYGITHLSAYAFSPENWNRNPMEIAGLMRLFQTYLRAYIPELEKEHIQLRIIGDISVLSPSLQKWIAYAHEKTKQYDRLILQIALNYGGRDDMLQATRRLIVQYQTHSLDPESLTKQEIVQSLWTASCPDPDLMIRTGGEVRLSNYMLWQLSYTELIFLSEYWPDFTPRLLEKCISLFHKRQRRFGSTIDDPTSISNLSSNIG